MLSKRHNEAQGPDAAAVTAAGPPPPLLPRSLAATTYGHSRSQRALRLRCPCGRGARAHLAVDGVQVGALAPLFCGAARRGRGQHDSLLVVGVTRPRPIGLLLMLLLLALGGLLPRLLVRAGVCAAVCACPRGGRATGAAARPLGGRLLHGRAVRLSPSFHLPVPLHVYPGPNGATGPCGGPRSGFQAICCSVVSQSIL